MATELETKIAQFETDLGLAHDIVHGGIAVEVVTEGGNVKSLAKLVKDAEDNVVAPATAEALAAQAAAETAKTGAEAARDQAQVLVNPAVQAVAGTDLDLATGAGVFARTFVAGPVALTVSNWPAAGSVGSFLFKMVNAGLADITWPAGFTWAGGIEPAWSSAATDIIAVMSDDGGTTIYAGLVFFGLNPGA